MGSSPAEEPKTPSGPLAGVRVVDLTSVVIGPYCTELLGDLGADVVKVEAPDGDLTRSIGPRRSAGMSAQFINFNRNKRSLVLDLKQTEGREALLRVAKTADVFVCNMRPQALERLGIAYADISEANPSIIYCRIVGYGPNNRRRTKPAIDDVIQAMSGVVSLQEHLTGTPSFVGLAMADATSGLLALSGILAALYRKAMTGNGEEVELPMYEAMASFVLATHMSGSVFDPPLGPPLYPRSVAPNRRPFPTADGALVVSPYTDRDWRRFLDLVGREDLLEDRRFATTYERSHHLDELYGIIRPILAERSTRDWEQALSDADVPFAPVQSTADLLADTDLWEAGLLAHAEHPTEGRLQVVGNPVRFTQAPCNLHQLPSVLGEHSRQVLAEAGYSVSEVEELVSTGATIAPASPRNPSEDAAGKD